MTPTVAVFVIDPGTTSGAAWLIAPLRDRIADMVLDPLDLGCTVVKGHPTRQARVLVDMLAKFRRICAWDYGIDPVLVMEDFILRKFSAQRELLDPVRVTSAFLAYQAAAADEAEGRGLSGYFARPRYQQPGDMGLADNNQLREWGLWVVGADRDREHERDARRHLGIYLRKEYKLP